MEEMAPEQLMECSIGLREQLFRALKGFCIQQDLGELIHHSSHSITLSLPTPEVSGNAHLMVKVATLMAQCLVIA